MGLGIRLLAGGVVFHQTMRGVKKGWMGAIGMDSMDGLCCCWVTTAVALLESPVRIATITGGSFKLRVATALPTGL